MEINKVNQTNFKGIGKMKNIEPDFNEQTRLLVEKLSTRAEREVCEHGDFAPVFEIMHNTDEKLKATDFVLNIEHPEGTDPKFRTLDASAYKVPLTKRYERTLVTGTKEDILKAMREEGFAKQVQETFKRLGSHFDEF